FSQSDGTQPGELGPLYRPKYFHEDGIAVHGYGSVPSRPASHGCVRVSFRSDGPHLGRRPRTSRRFGVGPWHLAGSDDGQMIVERCRSSDRPSALLTVRSRLRIGRSRVSSVLSRKFRRYLGGSGILAVESRSLL